MLDRTFNESVAYIEETMVKLGPFDGVLGFSQVFLLNLQSTSKLEMHVLTWRYRPSLGMFYYFLMWSSDIYHVK